MVLGAGEMATLFLMSEEPLCACILKDPQYMYPCRETIITSDLIKPTSSPRGEVSAGSFEPFHMRVACTIPQGLQGYLAHKKPPPPRGKRFLMSEAPL